MKRALILFVLTACDETPSEPPPSRYVAVAAEETEAIAPDEFCEVHASASDNVRFTWPTLEGETPAATSGWRWINVWATWCHPCIEELPRLARFEEELSDANVSLAYVSADADRDAITRFLAEHPSTPDSPRVPTTEALREWLGGLGLDEGAPLPVHLFVDPQGRFRCARTGALGDEDLPSLRRLLRST